MGGRRGSACDQPFAGGCLGEPVCSESFVCNNSNLLITTLGLTVTQTGVAKGACLSSLFYPPPSHLCNSWATGQPVLGRPGTICFPWGVRLCRGCAQGRWAPWEGRVELRYT